MDSGNEKAILKGMFVINKPELVIFDMDGTMLDTETLSLAAMKDSSRKMGYDFPPDLHEAITGRNSADAEKILVSRYGKDFNYSKAMQLHYDYMDNHIRTHGIPTKKGLYELLDALDLMGIKKCVATSTGKQRAAQKLELVGIANRFEVIVGGDEVVESKPNPEIFLKAAMACNVSPENCVIIEDSAAGTMGAVNAGIPVIIVPDIAPLTEELRANAVAVCQSLLEVIPLIKNACSP